MKILSASNNTQKPTFVNITYPCIPSTPLQHPDVVDIDKFVFNIVSYFILELLSIQLLLLLRLHVKFIMELNDKRYYMHTYLYKIAYILYGEDSVVCILSMQFIHGEHITQYKSVLIKLLWDEMILFSLWENSFI